jgi:hypothetical protein
MASPGCGVELGIETNHTKNPTRRDMEAFPDVVQDLLREISIDLLRLLKDRNQCSLHSFILLEDLTKLVQIEWLWHFHSFFAKNDP